MAINPCQVVDSLAAFQYAALNAVNRKFAALRALAALLEQLGDLSPPIPDITALIPVASLDLSAYTAIANGCPFLKLPAPGVASTAALQAQLAAAYAALIRQLLGHPWVRMGLLQNEMAKFQSKINFTLATGLDFLRCLQALCSGFSATSGLISSIGQTSIRDTTNAFASGFVANSGQVMTAPMAAKYAQVSTNVQGIRTLGASIGTDYQTTLAASAAVAASVQPAPPLEIAYPVPPFVQPPSS